MKKQLPPEGEWPALPRTRAEARGAVPAVQFYLTGQPCTNGHVAPRYTSNCTCVACGAGHGRDWLERTRPEREAEQAARKVEREAKREAELPARKAAAKERRSARRKQKMDDEGTEEVRAKEAKAVKDAYWRDPAKARARVNVRRMKGLVTSISSAPSIDKLRTPPALSEEERAEVQRFCDECPPDHTVDHIVPYTHPVLAGLHVLANLQYLPGTKNQSKGNRVTYSRAEAEALVARGVAVWAEHTDGGWVEWEHYPALAGRAEPSTERSDG